MDAKLQAQMARRKAVLEERAENRLYALYKKAYKEGKGVKAHKIGNILVQKFGWDDGRNNWDDEFMPELKQE